jgi:hypothetical protein
LLANLSAVRGDRPAATSGARQAGTPLAECLGSYFSVTGEIPPASPPVTASGSLLGQLPPAALSVRGHPLAELLQPAYLAFHREGPAGTPEP